MKDYLICCSVLKDEVEKLALEEEFEVIFLGMTLHSDYDLLEENLRKVIQGCSSRSPNRVIVVYGDDCLGLNGEMKQLIDEYGATKVDAINCIDCLLGGNGKYLSADPENKLIFLSPGWIKYFSHKKETATKEEQRIFKKMFKDLDGIIILDTLGNLAKHKKQIQSFADLTGLKIIDAREINTDNLKHLINHAKKRNT